MTRPLPNGPSASAPPPRTAAERERARVKVTRKWAYLVCTTTYVPLVLADLESALRELVDTLFAALTHEPPDLGQADRVGVRLVELNCVDKKSLQVTMDVLSGALFTDEDTRHLPPERVSRLLGAMAAGFSDALRARTTAQQESMLRAVKELAMKATRAAQEFQAESTETATELALLRRHLSHQLLHDALTGLPNRQFFTTRLEEVLNSGSPTTLYRIELDGFSVVDDGLGGEAADALLNSVASSLRAVVGGSATMVARFDRASFAVLAEQRPEDERQPLTPADIVARIADTLTEVTYIDELGLALTASIGVVQSPPYGTDLVDLQRAADVALRLAKEQGPGQWRLLMPDECAADGRLRRLAAIMPGALETGKLAVGYRLWVDLADDKPVSVDAYPRWDEAELAGQDCVALAEQTGLSPQIGQWLLRTAGKRLSTWGTDLPLSVSLSRNQSAAPDLVESVLGTLREVLLPADRLRLAMPAAEVFDGRPQALDNLTALARAGVRTSVRDFGGNPSDVVRLPDLPLRTVSLAPRLVAQARAANRKPITPKAIAGLTALVHEAGAMVAVDDLRTRPEVAWWRDAGADTATGPLFPVQGDP